MQLCCVLRSVSNADTHLTRTSAAQESSPGAGPGGQAAAGMFWQYGRDVAEQLQVRDCVEVNTGESLETFTPRKCLQMSHDSTCSC